MSLMATLRYRRGMIENREVFCRPPGAGAQVCTPWGRFAMIESSSMPAPIFRASGASMNEPPEPMGGGTNQPAATEFGPEAPAAGELPARIGPYRVEKLLGKGGFGCVYRVHDEQLDRRVAAK